MALPCDQTLPFGLKLLLQNYSSLVKIPLDNTNYLVWRAQLEAVLEANDLLEYVNGESMCPAKEITDNAAGTKTPNPEYDSWSTVNKHLRTCLIASISASVLPQVLHLRSAAEIWSELEKRYSSISRSYVTHLRNKLDNLSKGHNQTMQSYLDQVKVITDSLSAAGAPVSQEDLLSYILKGLPTEYESFRTYMRSKPISISELTSLLLTEELNYQLRSTNLHASSSTADLPTALNTKAPPPTADQSNRGRGGRHSNNYRGRGGRNSRNNNTGHSFQKQSNQSSSAAVTCQICNKPYHIALDCWHRFDTVNYNSLKPDKRVMDATATAPSASDLGDLKRIIAQGIGSETMDNAKISLMEDATTKNGNTEEMKASSEISIGSAAVAEVRLEVDKFSDQVSALEAVVNSGIKVDEKDINYVTEMLMRQLLKLDGIEAHGEGKVQRRTEVHRVQNFVETLDALKARNSSPFSDENNAVSVTSEWEDI